MQRDGSKADETLRIALHDIRDVIVQEHGKVERVLRLRPITEHDRNGRQHLHADLVMGALAHADFGIPAVVLDLAEEFSVDHHPGATGLMMLQRNEAAITELFAKVGEFRRQDMRVDVNF